MPFGGALSLGISAGSSLLSGIFGSSAADKAANQAATAATAAADQAGVATNVGTGAITHAVDTGQAGLSEAQKQQLALLQPQIAAGQDSTGALQKFASSTPSNFSFNPSDLQNDPGYKFTLDQGQQAIQRSAAAGGGLFSSGTLKRLANYTTGTANQYFNDAYNRAASTFGINRQTALDRVGTLQNLANLGSTATGQGVGAIGTDATQSANLGLTGAGEVANTSLQGAQLKGGFLTQAGNAKAAGTLGSSNAWLSALNGGTNSLLNYINSNPQKANAPVGLGPNIPYSAPPGFSVPTGAPNLLGG